MARLPSAAPPVRRRLALALAGLALALGACAGPAATAPPTATSIPPTLAAELSSATAPKPTATPAEVPLPVSANTVRFDFPSGIAVDADDNVYVTDITERIFKIDPDGSLTIFAGNGILGIAGDGGPALAAEFGRLAGLAFDHAGNLFVTDWVTNRIRRIDTNGIVTTVAGTGPAVGVNDFSGDGGPAVLARLASPTSITFDAAGNMYFVDLKNIRIRRVDPAGIITTVVGTGEPGFIGDGGPATAAQLNLTTSGIMSYAGFSGIAADADGNLYIADSGNFRVRRVDRQGLITTFAGNGEQGVAGDDGPATAAQLSGLTGLAFDADGNLYLASGQTDFVFDSRIRKIDRDGIITTVVGGGPLGLSGDGGPALQAALGEPSGLAVDSQGNLFIADSGNERVRKVDPNGIITTFAGGGVP